MSPRKNTRNNKNFTQSEEHSDGESCTNSLGERDAQKEREANQAQGQMQQTTEKSEEIRLLELKNEAESLAIRKLELQKILKFNFSHFLLK